VKRVAVTTSSDRLASVATYFRRVGLEPIALPCVRIEPAGDEVLQAARLAATSADLLILTSARPLDLLWPDGAPPPVPVAAVGTATAAAVARRRGRVEHVGNGGLVALIDLLGASARTKRVAYPHADGTDPALLEELAECTASLAAVAVYTTVPIAPGKAPVHAVAFASPSAVRGWTLTRGLDGTVVGTIGEATAMEVTRHGPRPHVVAHPPSFAGLAEALASYLEVAA
jgi:uroporphyrinogen-III synthase